MEFNDLHSNYPLMMLGVAGIIVVSLALGIFVLFFLSEKGVRDRIAGLIAVSVTALVFMSGSYMSHTQNLQREADFRMNIQQKYDVDEVLMEFQNDYVRIHQDESQKIYVLVDDKTYLFNLTQNKKTWEPTLSDPPINGGMDVTATLSADDLLKK